MGLLSCCCTKTHTVHVLGCNSLDLPGATVELKLGSTVIDSQTTDGGGFATVTGLSGVAYTLVVTEAPFNTYTGSVVPNNNTTTVGLTAATGYVCTACSVYPYPTTLYMDTNGTTYTLLYAGVLSGISTWSLVTDISFTGYEAGVYPVICQTTSVVQIVFSVVCSGGSTFAGQGFHLINCKDPIIGPPPDYKLARGPGGGLTPTQVSGSSISSFTPYPFDLTGTWDAAASTSPFFSTPVTGSIHVYP